MGRGSGASGARGGGGGGGGSSAKATAASNAAVKQVVTREAKNAKNINQAIPEIKSELDKAPVGTELIFDAYYNSKAGGMLQNTFIKTGADSWEHSWGVRGGQTYWTNALTAKVAAGDIFNAVNG